MTSIRAAIAAGRVRPAPPAGSLIPLRRYGEPAEPVALAYVGLLVRRAAGERVELIATGVEVAA